ncbi:glycosyl transferase [[Phormidium ambiguum] IAM M-71]|uniref:Glycosyl transferase n=1 Tax=[Phormidium ambiguum] IAM M-71 TaxID=454136 RepID=A0A1U7IEZ7_9CYAN|nr:glycosyl transferase [Phormidium ambiguum]OKH35565.1 glycosyl transferase [Phormidium ambiguum IAM M-71]
MNSRPSIYISITNHGFGHAARTASVAAEIQRLNPEILLILVTTAPRWLLESYITGDFIHRPRGFDIGVIQSDSINMDLEATLHKLKEIRQQQRSIIAGEVSFIQQNRVSLMLADIPPLAPVIAKTAGIPCWTIGNFGWDFIYSPWGGEFIEIADWIHDCFSQCDRLFRLPMHEPMSAFPVIEDRGLTGGTPRHNSEELREKFGINSPKEKTILLSFGGLGLQQIPYENIQQFSDWTFIMFDRQAPDYPNIIKITEHNYRPIDFMPICGRVISKPGFSTFSEALRLNTPIVTLTREGFAESPLLLEGIQNYSYHQIIKPAEFFESEWDFLRQDLQPPRQSADLIKKDGTESIAQTVVNYLQSKI